MMRLSTAGPANMNQLEDDSFDGINLGTPPIANPNCTFQPPEVDSVIIDQHPRLGPAFTQQEIRAQVAATNGNDVRRVVLRFVSRIKNASHVGDEKRSFIIQIYLEDNTLQIREPPSRNSGYKGGVFLRRTRMSDENGITFMYF